jgi:peptidoglycan/xylan/chitin deacetylase (PgdA/CDA1 family)
MFFTIHRSRKLLAIPENTVVLTFDDGPIPCGQSMELLDLLAAEQVPAGFCLVGRRIPGNEEIVQRIHADGHLIINHGDQHRMPDRFSDAAFHEDLAVFDERVATATSLPGWKSQTFRPTGGGWNRRLSGLLSAGERALMPLSYFAWDVFSFPFRERIILAGMLGDLRRNKGGLYLLHETNVPLEGEIFPAPPRNDRPWLAALVQTFIATAKAEGFRFAHPLEIAAGAQECFRFAKDK